MRYFPVLLFFFTLTGYSQDLNRDYLLTEAIFDHQLKSIEGAPEENIGRILNSLTIYDLMEKGVIIPNGMFDLAFPLGVNGDQTQVNFVTGMQNMWRYKCDRIARTQGSVESTFTQVQNRANAAVENTPHKMTLRTYRSEIIEVSIDSLRRLHDSIRPLYSAPRREFMDIISNNLSPNVLLGYNIQELIPPKHFTGDLVELPINPLFKAYYLDQLLREGGTEYIAYFPARYDNLMSYGPFQFTQIALDDIRLNRRLTDDFKIFDSVQHLNDISDHSLLAGILAYNNWESLSMLMQHDSTIQIFNDYFQDYATNAEKGRELKIFIAGMTACMHHLPSSTKTMIRDYFKEKDSLESIHLSLIEEKGTAQLKKYYRSSAEAYLILKVYHNLIPD